MSDSGLKAWTYFRKRFPNATLTDAGVLVDMITSHSAMQGVLTVKLLDNKKRFKNYLEVKQHMENIAFPEMAHHNLLVRFFGIDKSTKKHKNFDSVEIKDSLNWDPRVAKLFKEKHNG